VAVIRKFYHQLPGWIDAATREQVETELATQGSQYRPEQLAQAGALISGCGQ
jgi:hypothetical protein